MDVGLPLLASSVLFSGGLSLVLAVIHLFYPGRSAVNAVAAFGFLLKGAAGIVGGLVALGAASSFILGAYVLLVPATFASTACAYLYYRQVLARSTKYRPRDAIHAILPLTVLAIFLLIAAGFLPKEAALPRGALTGGSRLAAYLLSVAYSVALVLRIIGSYRGATDDERGVMRRIVGLRVFIFLIDLTWMVDRFVSADLAPYLYAVFSVYLAVLLLFLLRYPEHFLRVSADKGRYARSRIEGLNVEEVMGRLNGLMVRGAYRDPDLSLGSLAGSLGMTPHQLSELLNARLSQSFLEFVNAYRVAEAQRLLRDESGRKILDIALEAGFNSSSSFYNAFKKATGTTPADFRKAPRERTVSRS